MKMWEIRENYGPDYRMGYRKKHDDYECGYEDGYKAAMEELSEVHYRGRGYASGR